MESSRCQIEAMSKVLKLAPSLCSLLIACADTHEKSPAPAGTETDNPVVATNSPADFTTPVLTPPCAPSDGDAEPTLPDALPRSALIATARGTVLALADGGLTLLDVSDPAHPLTLSERNVRGTVSQLLVSASGKLWVTATEAPELDPNGVPNAEELAAHARLILFDVSDPTAPVRLAQAESEGWLQERGDQIWALTARPVAEALRCDAPHYFCHGPGYEAVALRGFRPNGSALEPVANSELPFDRRVWWNGDGVVTALEDGTLHVLSWDGTGALRAPLTLSLPETDAVAGPVQIAGHELSVVSVDQARATLHVYNLASSSAAPTRSFVLRDVPLDNPYVRSSAFSLFSRGYLWLQRFEPESASAQVWDVSGTTPVKLALPSPFATILPLDGVVREGQGGELLAIGVTLEQGASLLSLGAGQLSVLGPAPAGAEYIPYSNRGNPIPAPANLHGTGDAPNWNLFSRGPGLPIGIDPAAPLPAGVSAVQESLGIDRPGAEPAQVSLVYDYVYDTSPSTTQPNPRLQITSDGNTTNLELSPSASALLPIPQGVMAVATDSQQCEQIGRNCTGAIQGVQVFDLSGTPQLRASLPFPALPLPTTNNPNQLRVSWEHYDALSGLLHTGLMLDERRVAFVAHVDLSCDSQESCDALGLEAVPIGQTNVAPSGYIDCPPESAPGCVPQLVTLSVYGTGQRQYFYVLDLDATGGPAWQSWGASSLEATAARTDEDSRFVAPFATAGTLAATRLERHDPSGSLPKGSYRFLLDRFERSASGDAIALPAVNVPGYPVAKLGGQPSSERWISIEPAPGANGRAQLYRLDLRSDGAHIEQSLALDAGTFSGFHALQTDDRWFGLVLRSPTNACGSTQLSAIELGSAAGDANEPLGIRSTLELPADNWALVATDQNRALLRHDQIYTLVELTGDGRLNVVSSRSSDVRLVGDDLVGKTLSGAAGRLGSRRIDF